MRRLTNLGAPRGWAVLTVLPILPILPLGQCAPLHRVNESPAPKVLVRLQTKSHEVYVHDGQVVTVAPKDGTGEATTLDIFELRARYPGIYKAIRGVASSEPTPMAEARPDLPGSRSQPGSPVSPFVR